MKVRGLPLENRDPLHRRALRLAAARGRTPPAGLMTSGRGQSSATRALRNRGCRDGRQIATPGRGDVEIVRDQPALGHPRRVGIPALRGLRSERDAARGPGRDEQGDSRFLDRHVEIRTRGAQRGDRAAGSAMASVTTPRGMRKGARRAQTARRPSLRWPQSPARSTEARPSHRPSGRWSDIPPVRPGSARASRTRRARRRPVPR